MFPLFGALLFVIIGVFCAFFALKLKKRSLYLFYASFSLLIGFFLFLSFFRLLPLSLSQLWPLLSVFAGLSLIPAGWHRYHRVRLNYVVCALAFIVLGCFLLVFSLELAPFSFKQFIIDWWPLFFAVAGILLLLAALSPGKQN
jgi:hypothetical protein